jgi:hypothetical protein
MMMPFDQTFSDLYAEVKRVVADAGFKCVRADEIADPHKITDDIWSCIQRARFIVADITDSNANVFYEVGLGHALNKSVILLLQGGKDVPFDLKGIRYVRYSPDDLGKLRPKLINAIRACLVTIPDTWRKDTVTDKPWVRIMSVEPPESPVVGEPFHITIKAKNFGLGASQAYFSISFPSGIETAKALKSDIDTKVGKKGDAWKSGSVILDYPIIEAFVYKPPNEASGWPKNRSHFLTVEATASRAGLLQFYVSASAKVGDQPFVNDPEMSSTLDQRDEPIYCGIIEMEEKPAPKS